MTQEEIKVRVLIASEGCFLTQSAEVELLDRIITERVYLAANASPTDWKEITEAEADEIRAKQQAALDAENENTDKEL